MSLWQIAAPSWWRDEMKGHLQWNFESHHIFHRVLWPRELQTGSLNAELSVCEVWYSGNLAIVPNLTGRIRFMSWSGPRLGVFQSFQERRLRSSHRIVSQEKQRLRRKWWAIYARLILTCFRVSSKCGKANAINNYHLGMVNLSHP